MKNILLCLCLCWGTLSAQTLLEDATRLANAASVLADTSLVDSVRARALASLAATLWYYDTDRRSPDRIPDLRKILSAYGDNNTITSLIGDLSGLEKNTLPGYQQYLVATLDTLSSGPREEILSLLYAEQHTDPATYLSLLKTMQEYQEPPLDAISTLQAPATAKSDNTGSVGIFNEAAIIRGLFSFLIERAGEELVVTFLDRLLGKELPAVAKLFPTTLTLYGNTDYAYSDAFLASLRDAFLQDLQLLDVRLPELLLTEDLFAELRADPVFYGILTAYTVVALTKDNEVPIEQAIPLVARNLYQRYQDTEKERNLLLADTASQTGDYVAMIAAVQKVVDQSQAIYSDIEIVETSLRQQVDQFTFNPAIPFALRRQLSQEAQLADANGERFEQVFKAQSKQGYDLSFLPSLLGGELPAKSMGALTTLESYDKYFAQPVSPQQRRASGLALSRRLAGEEYGTTTLDAYFQAWRENLITFQNNLLKAELAAQTEDDLLVQRRQNITRDSLLLKSTLTTARTAWSAMLSKDEDEALLVLENVVDNSAIVLPDASPTQFERMVAQEQNLTGVKDRLRVLHGRILQRIGASELGEDPIADYLNRNVSLAPLQAIDTKISVLRDDLKNLRTHLQKLDSDYAANLTRSHDNADPLMQMGEVMSHLLFLLRNDAVDTTEQHFMDVRQLQSALSNAPSRAALLGLMEQNLNKLQRVGTFSRDGLSSIVQATVQDLTRLPTRVSSVPDSLRFYQKSAFVVNTLSRLLETPLFIDPLQPDKVYALTDKWKTLEEVPEITQGVLDLVYYISTKNYRQALSETLETTIRLSKEYEESISDKGKKNQHGLLQFFQQYGGFIGGLVDADSASQVQALLNAFADPPGSSRVKRKQPFTAGINAYVGGLFGMETLSETDVAEETTFTTLAPSIPIGATFSFLVGPRYRPHRPSFSLFFSVLDLGSLATFNLNETPAGDNQLTFRNVLKPGFQFQWNIGKSPFFLGTGAQYGPHYREFDGELMGQRSTRFFISFGIDVVVKRLY